MRSFVWPSRVPRALVLAETLILAGFSVARADTFHVAPDGSGDFPTIQAAVDAATPGGYDEIILLDGIYTGPGNRDVVIAGRIEPWLERNLVIRSASDDAEACVIDAQGAPTAFRLTSGGQTSYCVATLRGITITNCGVSIARSAGYAIVSESRSALTMQSCRVVGNGGGGLSLGGQSTVPYISDTLISGNGGVGLEVLDDDPMVMFCTITLNGGGGVRVRSGHSPQFHGCVIRGNCGPSPREILIEQGGIYASCSVLQMSEVGGAGSLIPAGPLWDEDPEFCDVPDCASIPTAEGDFRVRPTSVCLAQDSQCTGPEHLGAFGSCEPASLEGRSWARIKAGYR